MEDLPYDVLALLASWLDVHDLLYRLPLVCKLLYEIANDPVTWSRVVVSVSSYEELVFVLDKVGGSLIGVRVLELLRFLSCTCISVIPREVCGCVVSTVYIPVWNYVQSHEYSST